MKRHRLPLSSTSQVLPVETGAPAGASELSTTSRPDHSTSPRRGGAHSMTRRSVVQEQWSGLLLLYRIAVVVDVALRDSELVRAGLNPGGHVTQPRLLHWMSESPNLRPVAAPWTSRALPTVGGAVTPPEELHLGALRVRRVAVRDERGVRAAVASQECQYPRRDRVIVALPIVDWSFAKGRSVFVSQTQTTARRTNADHRK